jgi:hypothetical protein
LQNDRFLIQNGDTCILEKPELRNSTKIALRFTCKKNSMMGLIFEINFERVVDTATGNGLISFVKTKPNIGTSE